MVIRLNFSSSFEIFDWHSFDQFYRVNVLAPLGFWNSSEKLIDRHGKVASESVSPQLIAVTIQQELQRRKLWGE